jgi:hypothetical protein
VRVCGERIAVTLDLASDMDTVFLESGFEETVTSVPPIGAPVQIKAQVFRGGIKNVNLLIKGQNENEKKYDVEIYVSRTDVPIAKVNEYKFQFKQRLGDTADHTFLVGGIIREDEGAMRLGLNS